MTTLTTRAGKGSSLTHAELDANFPQASQTKAGAYTLAESDNRDTVEYSGAGGESFTLPDAATVAAASDTGDWEITVHHAGSGVLTIARTTGADTIDGAAADDTLTAGQSVTYKVNQAGDGYNWANDASPLSSLNRLAIGTAGKSAVVNQTAGALEYVTRHNYISGLVPSPDATDAVNDISITAGQCADSTNAAIMEGAAQIKRIDAAWTAGTNQGGFPSGLTLTDDTWYHIFAIFDVTNGLTDYGFDTSLTATNLLADATDYTLYRRVGDVLRGTATNTDFVIFETDGGGIEVLWKDPPLDLNTVAITTSASSHILSTPSGIKVSAEIRALTSANFAYLSSLDIDNEAPSNSAAPLANVEVSSRSANELSVKTNTSSQIRARATASVNIEVVTMGWVDFRR